MFHMQEKISNKNCPRGNLDVGFSKQRLDINCFKYVQRTKGNHIQIIKGIYENNVSPQKEYP